MNIFKKVSLLFILFLVIGIGCFAIIERDNTNKDLNIKLEQTEKTYSGKIDELTTYQEGLVTKIDKLQENVSNLTTSYNNLEETYNAYVTENELKLENLKTELASVKQSLADLQANSDVDKAKIAELQTKITNLEKSISEKNVTIEQLKSTIETQQATISELQKTITDLTNDLNSDLTQLTFYKNLMEGTVTEITAEDLVGVTKLRPYAFYGLTISILKLPNSMRILEKNSLLLGRDYYSAFAPDMVYLNEGLEYIYDQEVSENFDIRFGSNYLPNGLKYLGLISRYYSNKPYFYNVPSSLEYVGCTGSDLFGNIFEEYFYSEIDGWKVLDNFFCYGWNEKNCKTNEIPVGIRVINSFAFYTRSSLKSWILPSTIEYLGDHIFPIEATTITIKATVPPRCCIDDPFAYCDDNLQKIFVPAESVEAYKTADVWKKYADKIVAIEETA